ncbi:MAG: acyl-CoA dehydrogenase family protein, partial [Paracoccaceae bacterium]
MPKSQDPILTDLPALCKESLTPVDSLVDDVRQALYLKVSENGRVSAVLLEAEQFAAHAFSWIATYRETLRQMLGWAEALEADGRFGDIERLILQIGFGEYLAQLFGGIPMSQGEVARLSQFGVDAAEYLEPAVRKLLQCANTAPARAHLCRLMRERAGAPTFGATGLGSDLEMVRDQFRRFADDKVVPNAQDWHLEDALIPMEIIGEMAQLGVFGLTI